MQIFKYFTRRFSDATLISKMFSYKNNDNDTFFINVTHKTISRNLIEVIVIKREILFVVSLMVYKVAAITIISVMICHNFNMWPLNKQQKYFMYFLVKKNMKAASILTDHCPYSHCSMIVLSTLYTGHFLPRVCLTMVVNIELFTG